MEGIIRELNSYNRKRRRKRLFAGLGLSFLGGMVLGGAFLLGQARGRIDGLEEENAGLEKELSRTEEEKDKFESLYKECRPFGWEDPDIWERYVGGFFAALETDVLGERLFLTEGDSENAASQLYKAMIKYYGWKEKNWSGFSRAFERTYLNYIANPQIKESNGKKYFIYYQPLAPDWYEILADPENTDYESHKKGFQFLIYRYIGSEKKGTIQCDGNLNHMGRQFAEYFKDEIEIVTRQITFTRRVIELFKWAFDFMRGAKGEITLTKEEAQFLEEIEEIPPGYK